MRWTVPTNLSPTVEPGCVKPEPPYGLNSQNLDVVHQHHCSGPTPTLLGKTVPVWCQALKSTHVEVQFLQNHRPVGPEGVHSPASSVRPSTGGRTQGGGVQTDSPLHLLTINSQQLYRYNNDLLGVQLKTGGGQLPAARPAEPPSSQRGSEWTHHD